MYWHLLLNKYLILNGNENWNVIDKKTANFVLENWINSGLLMCDDKHGRRQKGRRQRGQLPTRALTLAP